MTCTCDCSSSCSDDGIAATKMSDSFLQEVLWSILHIHTFNLESKSVAAATEKVVPCLSVRGDQSCHSTVIKDRLWNIFGQGENFTWSSLSGSVSYPTKRGPAWSHVLSVAVRQFLFEPLQGQGDAGAYPITQQVLPSHLTQAEVVKCSCGFDDQRSRTTLFLI